LSVTPNVLIELFLGRVKEFVHQDALVMDHCAL
jgi:hypothetical protein